MKCIFLGPPGAGKGTQASLSANQLGVAHISTGEMLRSAVMGGTTLGRRVKTIMDSGQLVPDQLMVEIIKERTAQKDCSTGYILDGFPRTLLQAEALNEMFDPEELEKIKVVFFSVPEQILFERLTNRRGIESRSDDSDSVQRERLKVYRELTEPLVEYYRNRGMLIEVDGVGNIEEIHKRVIEAL